MPPRLPQSTFLYNSGPAQGQYCPQWTGPSHINISIINQENAPQTCLQHFLSWDSLFTGDSRLCQVDKKQPAQSLRKKSFFWPTFDPATWRNTKRLFHHSASKAILELGDWKRGSPRASWQTRQAKWINLASGEKPQLNI